MYLRGLVAHTLAKNLSFAKVEVCSKRVACSESGIAVIARQYFTDSLHLKVGSVSFALQVQDVPSEQGQAR